MEIIILLIALAVIFIIIARKFPAVSGELKNIPEGSENGDGMIQQMNKFEASEEDYFNKKRKTGKKMLSIRKEKTSKDEASMDLLIEKADKFMEKKEYGEAERVLIGGLEIDPTNSKIYNKLGIIYLEQGVYSDAKESFKIALKYDKHNDLTYNNLGLSLFNQGRYVEAIDAYQKSIQLNSLVPHRYINLGLAFAALRRYDKAIDAYKKALVLDKDNEDYQKLIREVTDKIAEMKGIE
ncbi:MAG TPA: tetratricopeptide repeat protein [Patescibacteria group bacterium]|nr:tetratricopeptide repeat protein [Patescibacteria group bacterium]